MGIFTTPNKITGKFPFDLVRPHLAKVESAITEQVEAFDPAVMPYMDYICSTSGKRIRPALASLIAGALGEVNDKHIKIGVIIELIHMATLVHDDIIDGATTRRKELTPNAKWGNGMAVLLGDALFAHALTLATDFGDIDICRKVGNASREVCQGEVMQTQRRFDLTLSRKDYFRIIEMKTGALFAAATGLAAKLSDTDEEIEQDLWQYGMLLGTAYQIYDDCLDLVGSEETVGKTLRTDLQKGKLTLPILNLLESAKPAQKDLLNKKIINQEPLDLSVLVGIAEYAGAVDSAVDTALKLIEDARYKLRHLDENKYKTALVDITKFLEALLVKCRS